MVESGVKHQNSNSIRQVSYKKQEHLLVESVLLMSLVCCVVFYFCFVCLRSVPNVVPVSGVSDVGGTFGFL